MKEVIVYGTRTCPPCNRTKQFLADNNIDFTFYDVSQDSKKAEEMMKKSGRMVVPIIDIEGKIIVGFDQEELSKTLELK